MTYAEKLEAFRAMVEDAQMARVVALGWSPEIHRASCATVVRPGPKYIKVDVGGSGKYMVVKETGEIFGIKGYGVIHRGHAYGTLDTIGEWDWSGYAARLKDRAGACDLAAPGCPDCAETGGHADDCGLSDFARARLRERTRR